MITSQKPLQSEAKICDKTWEKLFSLNRPAVFNPREVIYLKKEKDVGLVCLKKGVIKGCVYLPNGKERTVCILNAPGITGETSIFDNREALCSAVAVTEVEAVRYSIEEARELLVQHPDINFLIMTVMAKKMRSIMFQGESIHLSISKRLARMLLHLNDSGVYTQIDSNNLSITHELLASFLGTTRSRITLYLNNFVNKGFIQLKRGTIIIKDFQGLQDFIDSD